MYVQTHVQRDMYICTYTHTEHHVHMHVQMYIQSTICTYICRMQSTMKTCTYVHIQCRRPGRYVLTYRSIHRVLYLNFYISLRLNANNISAFVDVVHVHSIIFIRHCVYIMHICMCTTLLFYTCMYLCSLYVCACI